MWHQPFSKYHVTYCVPEREKTILQTSLSRSIPFLHKVLVATDFSAASQAAFRTALAICIKFRSSLIILHVFKYADFVPFGVDGSLLGGFVKEAQQSLSTLLKIAQQAGVSCKTIIAAGGASPSILKTISDKDIDLAILGTNAPHGFERLVFGSTADAVLRNAPCPVLTIGPQTTRSSQTVSTAGPIIFATDFNLTTVDAIRYAASFCKLTGSLLHCLHVLPRRLEHHSPNNLIPQIMTEALQHIANESDVVIDPPVCAVTYGSEISHAVVEYASQQKASLIILGVYRPYRLSHHHRSPMSGSDYRFRSEIAVNTATVWCDCLLRR
jgi:nucleotide-binding universal stress UspA family protein